MTGIMLSPGNELMTRGTPIEDAMIEEILNTIYLPLVRAR